MKTQYDPNWDTSNRARSNQDIIPLQLVLATALYCSAKTLGRWVGALFSSRPSWSLWTHRTAKIGTTNSIGTQYRGRVPVFLVFQDHFKFQRRKDVKYAISSVITLQPTKFRRKGFNYRLFPLSTNSLYTDSNIYPLPYTLTWFFHSMYDAPIY